jgi:hypothetical protein
LTRFGFFTIIIAGGISRPLLQEEIKMAVKKEEPAVELKAPEPEVEAAPGFYVGDNGPYPTREDAQAFIDGHLNGNGEVTEVSNA